MEKSRTLVLVATMRSPTIGSPDQTYLRARCAKLGRPRRATAPDFPACAASPKGTKELIWVHGQWSGDMMIDGVPDVRAVKGVRPLILSGASTQHRGGGRTAGAGRRHQRSYGQGTRTTHLGGHLLGFGDRHRQGGIAELTQGVIAAAQDLTLHRQGGVLAVVAVVRGRQLVVVGAIRGPAAGRALGRLERRRRQLGLRRRCNSSTRCRAEGLRARGVARRSPASQARLVCEPMAMICRPSGLNPAYAAFSARAMSPSLLVPVVLSSVRMSGPVWVPSSASHCRMV